MVSEDVLGVDRLAVARDGVHAVDGHAVADGRERIVGGMLLINTFPQLMLFGIILFASTTLFSFITLPVEINASQRALVWLSNAGITNVYTHDKAEDALRSAAYTYVVAALGSLATLLYYIMIFLGGRSRD